MQDCIQCGQPVDLSSENYTMYQVEGAKYLYCSSCKDIYEPYTSPREIADLKDQIKRQSKALRFSMKESGAMLVLGLFLGWVFCAIF